MTNLPPIIETVDQLEDVMTSPSPALIEAMRSWSGDLVILGVAGKMGPTLAVLARRALNAVGQSSTRVIGVARFSTPAHRQRLEAAGVETIAADLLNADALASLPDAPNVAFLVGHKFGSMDNEPLLWAMNVHVPAMVAQCYHAARIVALSTGNVYAFSPTSGSGPTEEVAPNPVGEYAQSCVGRERMFQYFSGKLGTRAALIRLNYAIDLRYGVLLDIATKVHAGQPIDLTTGYVNVIWQGDANEAVLRSFAHAASPPWILNLTGPEVLSVRELAAQFGRRLGREPVFAGTESPTALLSNAAQYVRTMGGPRIPLETMLDWIAHWVKRSGATLGKPTHYDTRDGKF